MPLATFKHIASKNADYGATEAYLLYAHDEFTNKPIRDEQGRLVPWADYRFTSLNCGEEDFAIACMRANLRFGKNQKREDVKSHHYIISFDPRDKEDAGLTLAQRTRNFEKREIRRLLDKNGAGLEGKKKTAAQLGISLASLYNKLNG